MKQKVVRGVKKFLGIKEQFELMMSPMKTMRSVCFQRERERERE